MWWGGVTMRTYEKIIKYTELSGFKKFLFSKNINYRTLAAKIGMSTTSLSNKINGKTCFDLVEVDFIANLFDMSAHEITVSFFPNVEKRNIYL